MPSRVVHVSHLRSPAGPYQVEWHTSGKDTYQVEWCLSAAIREAVLFLVLRGVNLERLGRERLRRWGSGVTADRSSLFSL